MGPHHKFLSFYCKPIIRPHLNNAQKQKRLQWAQKYLKTHFQTVLLVLPYNPGWSRWMEQRMVGEWPPCPNKTARSARRWRSHLLAPCFGPKSWGESWQGLFRDPETDHFLPWYKKNGAFCSKIFLMHDKAPSHAATNTSVSLAAMGLKRDMAWPPSSPDLTPKRTFVASSSKGSMRLGGSSHQNSRSGRLF